MHRRLAFLAALVVAAGTALSGCGGAGAADPYQLLADASEAALDSVQVNVGIEVHDGGDSFTIEPDAIGFVADEADGAFGLHVAIPLDELDLEATELQELGLAGESLELDVAFVDDQLFARSPFLGAAMAMLLGASGELPAGDLAGWLRFGTAAELESFAELFGGMGGIPAVTPPPMDDANEVKDALEDMGITLTNAGTEQRDGTEVAHLEAAIDTEKLLASDAADALPQSQLDQMAAGLEELELSADLWIETGSGRLVEVDLRVASTDVEDQWAEFAVTIDEPDGTIPLEVPAHYVEIPLEGLITNLMEMMGEGMLGG